MSERPQTYWWQKYEGPALLVFLITAIFMAGVSWWKLEIIAAQASDDGKTIQAHVKSITALEATIPAIRDSLGEIKQSLRDINNDLKTRH